MAPPLAVRIMAGIAWRAARYIASTFTCMTRRQSSGLASRMVPLPLMPTLLSR